LAVWEETGLFQHPRDITPTIENNSSITNPVRCLSYHGAVKLHQEGTIHNLHQQSFPVVLDLDATDDGHVSGFVNFHGGNLRPDGFPVGQKFSKLLA
jgi:hypothetical protein